MIFHKFWLILTYMDQNDPNNHQPEMCYKPLTQGPLSINNYLEFSIFSSQAQSIFFLLYSPDGKKQIQKFPLTKNKDQLWWGAIPLPSPESTYSYLIDDVEVVDPFAKAISTSSEWLNNPLYRRGQFTFDHSFNWEGVTAPKIKHEELVIYEMHVRGFTEDPSSKVLRRGTFLGIIEKIPYLKQLGVNAIELMPIFEFDEGEQQKNGLVNYWGYNSTHFFAIMKRFASNSSRLAVIVEFQTLVKELHKAGILVFLDVVYNHVSPLMNLEAIGLNEYFLLDPDGTHTNYTGCGNSINANSNPSINLILSSLRYFVEEFHVDGFRFDLGGALARGKSGKILEHPPLYQAIFQDDILKDKFFTAEPWDAVGTNLVGKLGHTKLSEWNGEYRYAARRFLNLNQHNEGEFANALLGFPDLFGKLKNTRHIVHYPTSHDGFSLADLVSYSKKHNEANKEENRDGDNYNASNNWGVEGATYDYHILDLRLRTRKNFHIANLMAIGIPMITMGDENGLSHKGNNNPYCQDGPINWFNWKNKSEEQALISALCELRKHRVLPAKEVHPIVKENGVVVICYDDQMIVAFNNRPASFDLSQKLPGIWLPILSSAKTPSLLLESHSSLIAIRP